MRRGMKGKGRAVGGRLGGKVATGAAIVAMTVGISVFGAVGSAQAATDSHWNIAYKGQTGVVLSVTAMSKTNAWAIGSADSGSSPEFLH